MDKGQDQGKGQEKGRWSWLPRFMPGVVHSVARLRAEHGEAWVNTCWHRGVVEGQPGWFYASEGGLSVGTPWPAVVDIVCARLSPTQVVVIIKPKEDAANGAH